MHKKLLYSLFLAILSVLAVGSAFGQGATRSTISGTVKGQSGETLPGATVIATNTKTGVEYGNITNIDGRYRLTGLQVGGPYEIKVSFVGYQDYVEQGIYLSLGQTFGLDVDLRESSTQLEEVEVVANRNDIFDGNRTGLETVIDTKKINDLPTTSRSIADFVRLNPLVRLDEGGDGFSISIAGQNNRFNAIYIDGAVNNDVFGLAGSGTNGGQTGSSPISLDAVEQFNVSVAPYDVRQSGFAGGSINLVTRSGSNEFEGSAYYLFRNENLAGNDPINFEERLPDFTARTGGFRVGGPIIKNKLFFFANVEVQRDENPLPFDFDTYIGDATREDLNLLENRLINDFNFDPGTFENNTAFTEREFFLLKLDYNINRNHKLSVRHQFNDIRNFESDQSDFNDLNYQNGQEFFPSNTNSSAIELNSTFGNKFSNKLVLGATFVTDDRDAGVAGTPAVPTVTIRDGEGDINFGAEPFSTANLLDQNIFTITNNFETYLGNHTLTVGTHNEFYSIDNLFIAFNFGNFIFDDLDQFLNDEPAGEFSRTFSQFGPEFGDAAAAATASFNGYQLGFYVQDEYQFSDRLKLTGGVRVDIYGYPTDLPENDDFNNNTIPILEDLGYDLQGARIGGSFINTQALVAPRFGFNYDLFGDRSTQVRGGIGIFNSRVPLVWPGGAYNNFGLNLGSTGDIENEVTFTTDIDALPPNDIDFNNPPPSGNIDIFADDFRVPQVWKTSIGVDHKLPFFGLIASAEYIYTNNINAVFYENLNLAPPIGFLSGTGDTRPVFDRDERPDPTYFGIFLASNTSRGDAHNAYFSITKPFEKGFSGSFSYSWNTANTIFDGTSSQNSSQWRNRENVNGLNFGNIDGVQLSDFGSDHRVVLELSYRKEYAKNFASQLSLFYNGQSGRRFSYVYNDNGQLTDQDTREFSLVYVPVDQNDINLIDVVDDDGNVLATAQQQWEALNAFIERDDHLSDRRGTFVERNGAQNPWRNIVDLRFLQDFYLDLPSGKRNTLQFSLDIFNVSALLGEAFDTRWGAIRQTGRAFTLLNFEGFQGGNREPTANTEENVPLYTLNSGILNGELPWTNQFEDNGFRSSRWQMQIGFRYIFGN